jgi:hypothetical protein
MQGKKVSQRAANLTQSLRLLQEKVSWSTVIQKFLHLAGRYKKVKELRRAGALAILTLTLAISAFAGTIDSPGIAAPPPPPSQTSTSITTTVILTILSLIR